MHVPAIISFSYSVLAHLLSFEPNLLSILWKAIVGNRAAVHRAGSMLATKEMLVKNSSPVQNWGKYLGLSYGLIVRLLALLRWGFLLDLFCSGRWQHPEYAAASSLVLWDVSFQTKAPWIFKNLSLEIFQSDLRPNNLSCCFILSEDVSGSLQTQEGYADPALTISRVFRLW